MWSVGPQQKMTACSVLSQGLHFIPSLSLLSSFHVYGVLPCYLGPTMFPLPLQVPVEGFKGPCSLPFHQARGHGLITHGTEFQVSWKLQKRKIARLILAKKENSNDFCSVKGDTNWNVSEMCVH